MLCAGAEDQDVAEQQGRPVLARGQHDRGDVAARQGQHGQDDFIQGDGTKHGRRGDGGGQRLPPGPSGGGDDGTVGAAEPAAGGAR